MLVDFDGNVTARFLAKYRDRYCYMGGSKTETKKEDTVQTNTINPEQMAMLQGNYATAKENAAKVAQGYTGNLVAGFNPDQISAQGLLKSLSGDTTGTNAIGGAMDTAQGLLGYKAPQISSPGVLGARTINGPQISGPGVQTAPTLSAPASVTAGLLRDTNLSPYQNPYTDQVVKTTLDDLANTRAQQQVRDNQASTAAGAFGGNRQAVRDSLTSGEYFRTAASTDANLRSAGYDKAVEAATGDINRKYGADTFNANAAYDAAKTNAGYQFGADQFNIGNVLDMLKTNAGYKFGADQFNANAGNNADQFNIGTNLDVQKTNAGNDLNSAQMRLGAAGTIPGFASAYSNDMISRAGLLGGVGDMQQQQEQAVNDANYQEFIRQLQGTVGGQQILNSALGLIPSQQTVTGSTNGTSTTKSNAGFGGILGGLGSLAMGVGSMGTSTIGGKLLGF